MALAEPAPDIARSGGNHPARPTPCHSEGCMSTEHQSTDLVTRLREGRMDGTGLRWSVTDIHREAADEIARLRRFVQFVADHSNDPGVVREAEAHGAK
jgi:hypothetical protein